MDSIDVALTELAERQHALVARSQGIEIGMSAATWRYRMTRGDWSLVSPRVARRIGAPRTPSQLALAAVLDVGPSAYVSHGSAAALWGLPGFRPEPLELIVVRSHRTSCSLATVHHPRHLPDPFAASLDGVPVVRPALLLLQLAPRVHPERLRRLLDRMWGRRLLSGPSVRRELASLMHRGRPGTAALRELLDSLPANYVPPASGLEGRFASILGQAGLPPMRRQVDLGDGQRWCGRVDFLDDSCRLVVEINSELHHSALTDVAADEERRDRLVAAGFTVAFVSDEAVWHHPREVVARVRSARAAARSARPAA